MSKSKSEEIVFVDAPLHQLMKHSQQVRSNIEAETFEAEREAAIEKFGLSSGDSSNGVQPENRKPATGRNRKQQQHVESKPDDTKVQSGNGPETAGTDGEGEPNGGTETGTPPEVNGGGDDGEKKPWD